MQCWFGRGGFGSNQFQQATNAMATSKPLSFFLPFLFGLSVSLYSISLADGVKKVTDGQRIPFIDGVLLLYDPADAMSIIKFPECLGEFLSPSFVNRRVGGGGVVIGCSDFWMYVLDAFDRAQLPVCLVSTKCDIPGQPGAPKPPIPGYEQIQTSATAHDSQKKCVAAILTTISRRNG